MSTMMLGATTEPVKYDFVSYSQTTPKYFGSTVAFLSTSQTQQ